MNDERKVNPLDRIAQEIEGENEVRRRTFALPKLTGRPELPQNPNNNGQPERQPYPVKNEDVPRAGELSSQVFNDLTARILAEMKETAEAQLNDAANRRAHALAIMDDLRAQVDKAYAEFENSVKAHQEKVRKISESVHSKVREETEQMKALSNRLRGFADQMNAAHESFFKEDNGKN